MQSRPLRIAQISDIHLYNEKHKTLLGVKTYESFHAVIDLLKQQIPGPDAILLTGDLTQDGSEAAYIQVSDALRDFQVPIYCIPGNHDEIHKMSKIYSKKVISDQKNFILEGWQFILLNSQKEGEVEGFLAASQLKFLKTCLDAHPTFPTLIAFHHQPLPVGSTWLDKIGLLNATALWDLLKSYPFVRAVFCGHVHQEFEGEKNGISVYSAPSTCIQFKRKSPHFALENLPPGYRWIELYPTGELKTNVYRGDRYVGEFQANAKGY